MHTRTLAAVLALALSLLTACDHWPGTAPKSTLDMTGTWTFQDGPILYTCILRADGTYTESLSLPSNIPPRPDKNGKWWVDGDDPVILHVALANGTADPTEKRMPITVNGTSISFPGDAPGSNFTRR